MYSPSKYKDLIKILLSANLTPSIDWNAEIKPNSLFLRHDVDFSVDYAHRLALVEESINIKSTYFFMLSSNMYNLLSKYNQTLVKEIKEMGHSVSLHFDPTAYDNLDLFNAEKQIFEDLIKTSVEIVSIHRPGPFLENNNISLNGINQTYHDKYFSNMHYLSDSGGRNVFPYIEEYLHDQKGKGLHLLVHPIWWMNKGSSPTEVLNQWRLENNIFLTSEIKANCKTYLDN